MDNEIKRKLFAEIDKTLALLDEIESRVKEQSNPMDNDEGSI
jgi:hypothetical protein